MKKFMKIQDLETMGVFKERFYMHKNGGIERIKKTWINYNKFY